MARFCIQRLDVGARSSAEVFDSENPPELDVLWVESVLEFPANAGESEGDQARMACVVLNLTRNVRVFEALTAAGQSLRGVRVRRDPFAGSAAVEDFAASLHERRVDFLHVIVLSGDTAHSTELAKKGVDRLSAVFPDATGVRVLAMNSENRHRPALPDFGVVEFSDLAGAGPSLLWSISTLLAPHLLTCLDAEDVEQGVGTATAPAQLVNAVWRAEAEVLEFESTRGRLVCASSRSAVAFLFLGPGDPGPRGALSALRSAAPACDALNYQVAIDLLQSKAGRVPVVMLCRA